LNLKKTKKIEIETIIGMNLGRRALDELQLLESQQPIQNPYPAIAKLYGLHADDSMQLLV
jgi:hypothetical protein